MSGKIKDLSALVDSYEAKIASKPSKAADLQAKLTAKINAQVNKGNTVQIDGVTVTSYTLDTSGSGGSGGSGSGTTGSTYTLTTGIDNRSGTSGSDTFDASLSASGTQTLGSADSINGGSGADELFAQLTNSVTSAKLTSIETVTVATSGAAAITLGLANASDVSAVRSLGSTGTGGLTISGISKTVNVSVADSATNHTITYNNVTGSSDTATLGVTGATGTITMAGVESITVNSTTTASTLAALTATSNASLTVTGDAALTITDNLDATVKTVNASAHTASVNGVGVNVDLAFGNASVTGGAGNDDFSFEAAGDVSAVGGAGNDVFRFDATGTFTTSDTVSGGDGTDTLRMLAAQAAAADAAEPTTRIVTGIETLTIDDSGDADTYSVLNIAADIATVNFSLAAADDGNNGVETDQVTEGNVAVIGGSSLTVNLGGSTTNAGAAVANNSATIQGSVTVQDNGVGTTDTATINNRAVNTTTGLAINVFANDVGTAQNIVSTGYETLTINSGIVAGATNEIGTITVTADAGATSSEKVVFTGVNAVSVGAITADIIDASALSGADATSGFTLNMVTTSTATSITGSTGGDDLHGNLTLASSISGGDGNDSITGGAANDTLLGGAGNDTITGGALNDSIDGGAGDDRVVVANNLAIGDVIVGGDGNDTLVISAQVTTGDAGGTVSGFERLEVGTATAQDLSLFVNNVFTRVDVEVTDLAISGAAATFATIAVDDTATGTVSLDRDVDTSANAATLLATTGGAVSMTALTATDEETLTLDSSDNAITVGTLTAGATDLKTLKFVGDNNIVITNAIVNPTALATIDASGMTGSGVTLTVNAINSGAAITYIAGSNTGTTTLTTGSGADVIVAGVGAISVVSGSGADTITGSVGDDTINGGGSADSMAGGAGNDIYIFSAAASTGERIDEAAGQGTADRLYVTQTASLAALNMNGAGAGSDLLGSSGLGIEQILIEAGATATFAAEQLSGNAIAINESAAGTTGLTVTVTDAVNLSSLTFTAYTGGTAFDDGGDTIAIQGDSADNTITGTSIAASITGGAGADTITGGAGADTIVGGDGADQLAGGAGVDRFVSTVATDGVDVYTDFDWGATSDRLELTIAALADAAGNATAVSTGVNGGAVAVAALAADTSIGAAATQELFVAAEALTTITRASTAAAIQAEAVTQLADGAADASANLAAGEGALILMTNATDYFLFRLEAGNAGGVTETGEVTLLGIFYGLDGANAHADNFV